MVTEAELRAAMSSADPNMLVKIVDWTTTIDDRRLPATIGFFVELAGDQGNVAFTPPLAHGIPTSPSRSLGPRTRDRTHARRADPIEPKHRLGPRTRIIPQTDCTARPIWDV